MKNIELTPDEQTILLSFIDEKNENYNNEEYIPAGWKQIPFQDLQTWVDSQISPIVLSLINKGILSRHIDFKTSRYGEKSMKVRITVCSSAMIQRVKGKVLAEIL